ncbi:hypothetical protein [Streptomyces sp. TRM49041]|uniref:hypothetical protein n=1 Tax=Streptomyces sp. TRM49041 TaxID=2603216 RepID=UPI0011EC1846|nr:hypothetical protein [Streptomyces sp. TRM49041]
MNDRERRAALCSALPWLMEDLEQDGRLAELDTAVRAVLADTPVLEATAGLDIPPHVLGEPGPVRGEEPGDMVPGTRRRSAGESYRCPDGWCSLNAVRAPGGQLPSGGRCWLRDRPLRVVEA